ncbi:MAG: hypothetical protein R3B70_00635 [Polyangiaceae bacterium]
MRPRTAAALALGLALSLAVSMPVRAGGTRALRDAIEVQSGSCLSRDALVRAVAAWRGADRVDKGAGKPW